MTREKTKEDSKKEKIKKDTKLSVPLYNQKGELIKKISLPDNIFGQNINPKTVPQVIRVYLANQKEKLASTKTRSEVTGGGRKPWRQKGTGRARAGSIRAPGRRGGGIIFGPKAIKKELKLTKKIKQKALVGLLSEKLSGNLVVVEKFDYKEPKTKKATLLINKVDLKDKRSLLLVLEEKNSVTIKSFRNIKNIHTTLAVDLNALDVLKSSGLIFTLGSIEKLKERVGGANA